MGKCIDHGFTNGIYRNLRYFLSFKSTSKLHPPIHGVNNVLGCFVSKIKDAFKWNSGPRAEAKADEDSDDNYQSRQF